MPTRQRRELQPGGDRRVALHALEVEDEHEHQREARQAVEEGGRGGRAEQAVLEDREVEHRRAVTAARRARTAAGRSRQRPGRRTRPAPCQPSIPPLEMPSTSPVRPIRNVTRAERVEASCPRRRPVISRRIENAQTLPIRPNGTLNQKTQCQEMSTSAPPSTGPITRPTAATIVLVPIATPSCSRGNASVTIAAELANRNAPPIPWSDPPDDQLGAAAREARRRARRPRTGGSRRCRRSCGRTGPTAARR